MTHSVKKLSFIVHEWDLVRVRLDVFTDSLGPHRIGINVLPSPPTNVIFDPGFPGVRLVSFLLSHVIGSEGRKTMAHADTSNNGDHKDPLTAALESLPLTILLVDRARTIRWINKRAETLFGQPHAGLVGQSIQPTECGLWIWSRGPVLDEILTGCLDRGRQVCKDRQGITILGDKIRKPRSMTVTASPLLVANERLALLVLEDAIASEEDKTDEAETLHRAIKTARVTAHELNQPLSVLVGHIELLMRQLDADNPVKPRINKMSESADRLAETVHRLQMVIHTAKEPGLIKAGAMSRQKESAGV